MKQEKIEDVRIGKSKNPHATGDAKGTQNGRPASIPHAAVDKKRDGPNFIKIRPGLPYRSVPHLSLSGPSTFCRSELFEIHTINNLRAKFSVAT